MDNISFLHVIAFATVVVDRPCYVIAGQVYALSRHVQQAPAQAQAGSRGKQPDASELDSRLHHHH